MRPLVAAFAALLLLPAAASAHPLGNFSVNHLAEVRVTDTRVDVRYIVDAAEIPTLQGTAEVKPELERLVLTVDGKRTPLVQGRTTTTQPPGQGGLKTTRTEVELSAAIPSTAKVTVTDNTFPGRVGWRAVVTDPKDDPTDGLRTYPEDALTSPADTRAATVTAPAGFAGILDGDQLLLVLLFTAFAWGAIHALSPGHGKAMVAAYLVGTQGRPRDAVALGGIVTVTHTAGVFALGFITLALSRFVLPEDLFPYLNLASGLLVIAVGLAVLRRRTRHHHHHHHHDVSRESLLAMGTAAGLIPCPSALVVLLGAISQDQVALGMLLIVVFSLGLAATLTALGLAVVQARRLPLPGPVIHALPTVSAIAIVAVGGVLTAHALPTL
jgi:ABC-type nickel/cobalt efflux system permease component RcnA